MNIVNKVYAADPWSGLGSSISSDFSSWDGLLGKISELFNFIVPFSALVAIIMIIVGGYSLMTSTGNPEKIKKGWGIVTAAIVGMVIVFLSQLIVRFLIGTIE